MSLLSRSFHWPTIAGTGNPAGFAAATAGFDPGGAGGRAGGGGGDGVADPNPKSFFISILSKR